MQRTATPLTSVRFRSQPPHMKILITGCAGFIGFHLCKALLDKGFNITGVDNLNDYYNYSLKKDRCDLLKQLGIDFINQDINNLEIKNKKFDLLINLAAQAGVRVSNENEYLYEYTNVKGFENICRFSQENDIKKIIYASSSSVYDDKDTEIFSEGVTKLSPKSKYGQSKLRNELFAQSNYKKFDISFIGLRFFSVYGPFGRPDMAYFKFTDAISKQEELILNNEGKMKRDMTYIDDVVNGIMLSINYISSRLGCFHEIFNLGNGKPIMTSELLKIIERMLGKNATISNQKTKNESLFTNADIKKSQTLLGYDPKISIDSGIDQFIKWYKEYEKQKKR